MKPGPEPKLTPLQFEVVRELVASGDATFDEAAKIYGCHVETLRKRMRALRPSAKLPQGVIDEVVEQCLRGKHPRAIASDCEVSEDTVYTLQKQHHIPRRQGAAKVYSDEFKAEVVAACRAGQHVRRVADRFGVAKSTVSVWVRNAHH